MIYQNSRDKKRIPTYNIWICIVKIVFEISMSMSLMCIFHCSVAVLTTEYVLAGHEMQLWNLPLTKVPAGHDGISLQTAAPASLWVPEGQSVQAAPEGCTLLYTVKYNKAVVKYFWIYIFPLKPCSPALLKVLAGHSSHFFPDLEVPAGHFTPASKKSNLTQWSLFLTVISSHLHVWILFQPLLSHLIEDHVF